MVVKRFSKHVHCHIGIARIRSQSFSLESEERIGNLLANQKLLLSLIDQAYFLKKSLKNFFCYDLYLIVRTDRQLAPIATNGAVIPVFRREK